LMKMNGPSKWKTNRQGKKEKNIRCNLHRHL
jgi:hypothetical protein